ncbi:MAG: MFS transporter [Pseudomonadota bacterium]
MALNWRVLAAFALPALPLTGMYFPVYVFLGPFYAQEVGLSLAFIGTAFLAIRLVDAVSDPLMGVVSDKLRTPFGRRRIWLVAGLPLVMASVWFLFVPVEGTGEELFFLLLLGLTLGWTVMLTPYFAWGAELSGDYAERGRIAVWRDSVGLVGTIVAAILYGLGESAAEGMRNAALLVVLLLPLAVGLCVWRVPEPQDRTKAGAGFGSLWQILREDRRFARLLAAYFLNGAANALPAALFLFYVDARLEAPDWGPVLLIVYFGSGVLAAPLWIALVKRFDKARIWSLAMIWAAFVFAFASVLGPGDIGWFVVICVLSGAALGADLSLPSALQADLVDIDTARSGEQRTGLFFALWSLVTKAALAIAGGVALIVLERGLGFDAAGDNAPDVTFALALLYGLAPVILKLMAVALMWSFPLSRDEAAHTRSLIEGNRV